MISVFDYLLTHSELRRELLFAVLAEYQCTPPPPEEPAPAPVQETQRAGGLTTAEMDALNASLGSRGACREVRKGRVYQVRDR